jgi:hypothetical protein
MAMIPIQKKNFVRLIETKIEGLIALLILSGLTILGSITLEKFDTLPKYSFELQYRMGLCYCHAFWQWP